MPKADWMRLFYDWPKLLRFLLIVGVSVVHFYFTCDTPKQSGHLVTKTVTPGSDDLTSKIRMTDTYPGRRTQPELILHSLFYLSFLPRTNVLRTFEFAIVTVDQLLLHVPMVSLDRLRESLGRGANNTSPFSLKIIVGINRRIIRYYTIYSCFCALSSPLPYPLLVIPYL